ncbi:hypothetical protein DFH09DRAFT_1444471 [Mycena vulgaris]|nr:hypothetical protein DFH09DRAFT_1444471 [Mycena vulgaris]
MSSNSATLLPANRELLDTLSGRGLIDRFRNFEENAACEIEASLKTGILQGCKCPEPTVSSYGAQSAAPVEGSPKDLPAVSPQFTPPANEVISVPNFPPTSPVFPSLNAIGSTSAVTPAVSPVFGCLSLLSSAFSHAVWSTPAVIAPSAEPISLLTICIIH